ncbi:carbonic anhydrase [Nocardiopsis sp. HNM0947]|uniref:carbonic anhydrase n=1 Tax=Nocardiopsis coralli TaxID=2772213 RepID=A0ABR9PCI8_9ACTN|nr:carbonic anhydrase [Nocardiopsis coralli]MBE3001532.1 carbonic anhydrase [Nocardiopsis coralli]
MSLTRRGALRASLVGGMGAAFATSVQAAPALADADPLTRGPDEALELLRAGNQRWRAVASEHPNEGGDRREELVEGQNPFALVLGCADSRVPPELVFDRGLGDLFTVRSAGQVLDLSVMGSLVYAVEHLEVPLIVVMGHATCGAVDAAVEAHHTGELPDGHVGRLVEEILPVVESVPEDGDEDAFLDACVRANADHIAGLLRQDEELREFVDGGSLEIVAAHYDLATSHVDWR